MDFNNLFLKLPHSLQNIAISLFNSWQYYQRHDKRYRYYKKWFKEREFSSKRELKQLQNKRLREFIINTYNHSGYYKEKYKKVDIESIESIEDLPQLPLIKKSEIRNHLDEIVTIDKSKGHVSKTGGTTGNSMKVIYDHKDRQERFALLDVFRERFEYQFGEKTAWFSGKELINNSDIKNNRYWKYDFINKIKFYSTFHINDKTALYYLENIKKFRPKFIVGFPSSIYELAKFGVNNNISLGNHKTTAIFPTAETLVKEECEVIENYFGGGVYDQYASSEGAPFITECEFGHLHFEVLSGVIEVVDEEGNPSNKGRMLVTSFSTSATPLIRYDIGDSMEWFGDMQCNCGRKTPIVKKIHGRINDYVYSRENGKINLGNISNCVKGVDGIDKFQVIQDSLDSILVKMIVNKSKYGQKGESVFTHNLRARLGDCVDITIKYVDDIPKEKSGKFRIVKNNIKQHID